MNELHQHAKKLLDDFWLCMQSRAQINVIDIQLDKEKCVTWAISLNHRLTYGSDEEIHKAITELEPRLEQLKKRLCFDILKSDRINT